MDNALKESHFLKEIYNTARKYINPRFLTFSFVRKAYVVPPIGRPFIKTFYINDELDNIFKKYDLVGAACIITENGEQYLEVNFGKINIFENTLRFKINRADIYIPPAFD